MQNFDSQAMSIEEFRPKKLPGRRYLIRAAVALILRPSDKGTQVLMMRRSEREGDPWSGHMAFPGGKKDRDDSSTFITALRETEEEIGIERPERLQAIGRLSDVLTRPHSGKRPMVVTPFVFALHEDVQFKPNHEVAELVWIPLDYLANRAHREKMRWKHSGMEITLPCYFYNQQRIWGLSLTMLDELVGLLFRQTFPDTHSRMQFRPRGARQYVYRAIRKIW
ncbi:MAG: NUDIX hydrolase [Pseudomonadales bacterium]